MKVKVKLDAASLKEMALEHVEKIGLGAVALIALFLIYSAFSNAKSYDKTPEQLKSAADNADRNIESTTIEQAGLDDLKVTDYLSIAKNSRTPVKEADYETKIVWDKPLFEPKELRPQPALYAATDLRAKADFGALTENVTVEPAENPANPLGNNPGLGAGNMNTTEVRGEQWVSVTALVPFIKQEQAYGDAFRKCRFPLQTDYPEYLDFWVERVELDKPTAIDNIDWTNAAKFRLYEAVKKAKTRWQQIGGTDIVEQKYLRSTLVFPLPQLVGKQWDEQVAHAPEVPLPSLEPGMGGTRPGMGAMGDGFMEGMMPPGGNPGMMGHPGAGGLQPGMDPLNPNKPVGPDGKPVDPAAPAEVAKQQEHLLLRFLDFDVEPGKKYAYRVKLALTNPNFGLKPNMLADPKLAEKRFVETKWSDPTPVVSVPRVTDVLAVKVEPAREIARVMVSKWVQMRGFMAHEEFDVGRGQVINYADKTFRRLDGSAPGMGMGMGAMPPAMGMEGGMPPGMGMEGLPPAGRTPDTRGGRTNRDTRRQPAGRRGMEEFGPPGIMGEGGYGGPVAPTQPGNEWLVNYYTEAIAVDFRGGEKLTPRGGGDLDSVGEVLLFDIDGNLIVRNELDDLPEREKITAAANPTNTVPGAMPGLGVPGVGPRGALDGLFQQQEPEPRNDRRRRW